MIFLNEHGGSKADTTVKLALIFFISLFSFSVGTFVGKKVSDQERRRASLEDDFSKQRGTASVDSHALDVPEEEALTKDDIDHLTDEFLKAESEADNKEAMHDEHPKKVDDHATAKVKEHPTKEDKQAANDGYKKVNANSKPVAHAKKETTHAKKEVAHTAPKKKATHNEPVSKAAARVAAQMAPSKAVAKKRKPSSTLPTLAPTAIGKYTVQVSSYSSEKEASAHAAQLKGQGYSAFYVSAHVKGKMWYRVSIGLFDNYKSATFFKKELKRQAKITSAIIQKIVQ